MRYHLFLKFVGKLVEIAQTFCLNLAVRRYMSTSVPIKIVKNVGNQLIFKVTRGEGIRGGYHFLLEGKLAEKKRKFIFCLLFQCAKLHQHQPRKSLGKLFSQWRCCSTFEREKLLSGYLGEAYFDGFSMPKPSRILFFFLPQSLITVR